MAMKDKQFQPVSDGAITTEDVREFMRRAGRILEAIGDGRIPLDGGRADDAGTAHQEPTQTQYKATIRELRAKQHPVVPSLRRVVKTTMPPRVAVELIIPAGGHIDRTNLSNAAHTVVKCLVLYNRMTIKELMEESRLSRSTVQNALTELRQRNLVQSVKLDGLAT